MDTVRLPSETLADHNASKRHEVKKGGVMGAIVLVPDGRARQGVCFLLQLVQLHLDFCVDLLRMVVVIGHGGVNFGQLQVRIMAHHVCRSKPPAEIIHDQQRHARARLALQTRRFPVFFNHVRIALDRCHDCPCAPRYPVAGSNGNPTQSFSIATTGSP
jgi:hypothetical protein